MRILISRNIQHRTVCPNLLSSIQIWGSAPTNKNPGYAHNLEMSSFEDRVKEYGMFSWPERRLGNKKKQILCFSGKDEREDLCWTFKKNFLIAITDLLWKKLPGDYGIFNTGGLKIHVFFPSSSTLPQPPCCGGGVPLQGMNSLWTLSSSMFLRLNNLITVEKPHQFIISLCSPRGKREDLHQVLLSPFKYIFSM